MNRFECSFLSKLENEAFIRAAVIAFIMPLNPTIDEIMEIKTIVAEAVVNCLIHGYEQRQDGMIKVIAEYDDSRNLSLTISDRGIGIQDIELAKQPLFTTKAELERSGMGMTIMESFSDSFEICSKVNEGTTVIIGKKLSSHE